MTPDIKRAEEVFAAALEHSADSERESFLQKACAGEPELHRLVTSLLNAHEQGGRFLRTTSLDSPTLPPSTRGTGLSPAAELAESFLQGNSAAPGPPLETFLVTVPEPVRRETRERIEAAVRIRSLGSEARAPVAKPEDHPPALSGFRIERRLGAGGLGVVYAAHDEKLNRRVALKILRPGPDGRIHHRLLEEARKTAALSDPAIVTVYSVLDDGDAPAIVMELIEGFPLDRFAEQLNFEQKARLLREVARGLGVAHDRGLIHRDLKPDNVIVGPDMRPRLLDFGIALSLEEASQAGGSFQGTPLYASPEQVRGRPLTPASDVFSFGSLMFKVLTGRTPFPGGTVTEVLRNIVSTAPPFPRDVSVGVPEDLQAICLACLAWDPEKRPTAAEITLDLGRYLTGEPVHLKPNLYTDLLRQRISEYSNQTHAWQGQGIISREERDSLEVIHRRILADEDHWIIDARRITAVHAFLYGGTWLTVVATVLTVWLLRDELSPLWRLLLPALATGVLLVVGHNAHRRKESLAAATFLAGTALAIAPCTLSLLAEAKIFPDPIAGVTQLFGELFTNQQVLAAALTALIVSSLSLWRLKMTGFAWTTAALGIAVYLGVLLQFGWLDKAPNIQALWCLPLVFMEAIALALERWGRVRWTLPFHLVSLVALVATLDVMASEGPTLDMLGLWTGQGTGDYLNHGRRQSFSFVLNGVVFLTLMLMAEKAASLDLRRASKLLEVLALLHTLSALFVNAMNHRDDRFVRVDVYLYIAAALLFVLIAPWRSRWRLLVGGLIGCGFGSYLLVDLGIVARKPFIFGLGLGGLLLAVGAYVWLERTPKPNPGLKSKIPADSPEGAAKV